MSNEHYLNNPLVHRDRRLGRRHTHWVNQFDCSHMRPLIICRGPIRKEAIDVFREMGISHIEASPLTRSSYHAKQAEAAASG